MNYHSLFPSQTPIRIGLIGTGAYGNSLLYQTRAISRLQPAAVCDIDIDAARLACLHAGWSDEALFICSTSAQASAAIDSGRIALVQEADLLMDLPLDAIVEATGNPEAGARHAQAAIEHGMHVIMVSKETECVVGPILAKMARENGLVYTQADGDQPSMLIGLISWAQTLGLDIICAGKASECDIVYDTVANTLHHRTATVNIPPEALNENGRWSLWQTLAGDEGITIERRASLLQPMQLKAVADLCEMAVVMNCTDLTFDTPALHAPVARINELPELFALREEGGILENTGVIDVVNCLRREDEVSFAGGVFVVFAVSDKTAWRLLSDKGHLVSRDLTRAAVFVPYHLLGVETATSILAAVDLGLPTGGMAPQQHIDLCAVATEPLLAGQTLTMSRDHVIVGTRPELGPASPISAGNSLPYYMAAGMSLTRDVAAGETLSCDMIVPDPDSVLWSLRRRQDSEMDTRR